MLTCLAPLAWGCGYYVTATYLPPERPLFGAAVRALPFGLLVLALRPRLPRGHWWWRAAVLGTLNVGAFFVLFFVAAYRLPGGLAATLTATAPIAVMLLAWLLVRERPRRSAVAGAAVGAAGVALLVLRAGFTVDALGVAASLGAVALSSLGFVLTKRWDDAPHLLTLTGWQLVAGGLLLTPLALVVEGAPPPMDAGAVGGFLFLGLVGTVLAYTVWFRGLQRLPAASVALVGLLNPVAGTAVGVALAGEAFGPAQAAGVALVLGGVLAGQPAVSTAVRARLAGTGRADRGRAAQGPAAQEPASAALSRSGP